MLALTAVLACVAALTAAATWAIERCLLHSPSAPQWFGRLLRGQSMPATLLFFVTATMLAVISGCAAAGAGTLPQLRTLPAAHWVSMVLSVTFITVTAGLTFFISKRKDGAMAVVAPFYGAIRILFVFGLGMLVFRSEGRGKRSPLLYTGVALAVAGAACIGAYGALGDGALGGGGA